jgi:transposase-like protein
MNKRTLTADRWRELIGQQQRSGLSIAAFCAERAVAASTFFAWRRKLEARQAPAFVELTHASIELLPPAIELLPAPIELLLPGGLAVRVREGFDAATLRRVVEALR